MKKTRESKAEQEREWTRRWRQGLFLRGRGQGEKKGRDRAAAAAAADCFASQKTRKRPSNRVRVPPRLVVRGATFRSLRCLKGIALALARPRGRELLPGAWARGAARKERCRASKAERRRRRRRSPRLSPPFCVFVPRQTRNNHDVIGAEKAPQTSRSLSADDDSEKQKARSSR